MVTDQRQILILQEKSRTTQSSYGFPYVIKQAAEYQWAYVNIKTPNTLIYGRAES